MQRKSQEGRSEFIYGEKSLQNSNGSGSSSSCYSINLTDLKKHTDLLGIVPSQAIN